jgi:hypothetical protein
VFEYLMPLLVMPNHEHAPIHLQTAYGNKSNMGKCGVPWGISRPL